MLRIAGFGPREQTCRRGHSRDKDLHEKWGGASRATFALIEPPHGDSHLAGLVGEVPGAEREGQNGKPVGASWPAPLDRHPPTERALARAPSNIKNTGTLARMPQGFMV